MMSDHPSSTQPSSTQPGGVQPGGMQPGRVPAQRWAPPATWPPTGTERARRRPTAAPLVALGAVAAAAVVELSAHTTRTVNGVVTECSYVNVSPLLVGPIAIVAGAIAIGRSGRPDRHRPVEAGLGILAVVLGVLQMLGAFDLLGGLTLTLAGDPC
jgi:hypothetical protein